MAYSDFYNKNKNKSNSQPTFGFGNRRSTQPTISRNTMNVPASGGGVAGAANPTAGILGNLIMQR